MVTPSYLLVDEGHFENYPPGQKRKRKEQMAAPEPEGHLAFGFHPLPRDLQSPIGASSQVSAILLNSVCHHWTDFQAGARWHVDVLQNRQ
jgi:hypothetical protein